MLPFPLYFLLFLPFLSLVAARWDELNAANIPNDANATYTFPDGILMVNCTAENNPVRCDVYLDARLSAAGIFKFEFAVCTDNVLVTFGDGRYRIVALNPGDLNDVIVITVNMDKTVTSFPNLDLPPLQKPIIPGADSIVKIKVGLRPNCAFKLLDGKAFVQVFDESTAGSKSAVSTTQIGIIVGSCVGGVLLIVVVIVLVYCCWWKKRNKKDKNKEVQDAKNPLLNEHALTESTDGAKPIDKEKNTVVNESKDKKASKAVTKKSEIPDVVADSNKEGVSSQKAPKSIVDVPKEDKKQGAATPKEKRPRRLSAATPRESTEHVKVATPKAPKNRSKSVGSMLDTDKDPKVVAVIKRNKTMDVAPTQEQTLPVDATQEYEGEAIIAALEKVKNRRLKFLLEGL